MQALDELGAVREVLIGSQLQHVGHGLVVAGEGAARFLVCVKRRLARRDRGRIIERCVVALDGVGTLDLPGFGQPSQGSIPAAWFAELMTQPLLEVLDLGKYLQFARVRLRRCEQHMRNSNTISTLSR